MSENMRVWLHGLAAAAVVGGATALSGFAVDPQKFNLVNVEGLLNFCKLAVSSSVLGALLYLKASPLPPLTTVTTTSAITDGTVTAISKTEKTTQQ